DLERVRLEVVQRLWAERSRRLHRRGVGRELNRRELPAGAARVQERVKQCTGDPPPGEEGQQVFSGLWGEVDAVRQHGEGAPFDELREGFFGRGALVAVGRVLSASGPDLLQRAGILDRRTA